MKIMKFAEADDDKVIVMRLVASKITGKAHFEIVGQELGPEGCLKIANDGSPINSSLIRYWAKVVGIDVEQVMSTDEDNQTENQTEKLPSAFETPDESPNTYDEDDAMTQPGQQEKKLDLNFGV